MELSNWNLETALQEFRDALGKISDRDTYTEVRNAYLSKKQGLVTNLTKSLRDAPKELKPRLGKEFNQFKKEVESALKAAADSLGSSPAGAAKLDLTLPGVKPENGSLHPLTLTLRDMVRFFVQMGFDVSDGPEIETSYYNFTALNTPDDHPAREDADTYYINDDQLLRTQTSGCQVRYMENHKPPLRMVAPGKVFRRDDDVTHSPMFHQLEGLVIGEGITFADLKGTLEAFAKYMYGEDTAIRLRPSYFPFTEPSAEVDVTCPFCEDGCRICSYTKWIEILGSGMVDPNVLEMSKIDPEKYTGFAFGMGIERVAMLRYGVPDIRYFYQNDRRFLDQFRIG